MKTLTALLLSTQRISTTPHIHHSLQGTGTDTLVLIHGYGVHSGIWDQTTQELAQSYQVLTLDLRGHGQSDKPHEGYSVKVFAEDIHQLLTQLNIDNPILIGWSLGGYIAQYYTTHYPTKKLILACTSPTWVPEEGFPFGSTKKEHKAGRDMLLKTPDEYYEACVQANLTDHCTETDKKERATQLRTILRANDKQALAAILEYFTKNPASLVSNLSKITVPTLIISCGQDPVSPPAISLFMKERIKNAQLFTIPCGGHAIMQTRPKEFSRIIKSFLQREALQESTCLTINDKKSS